MGQWPVNGHFNDIMFEPDICINIRFGIYAFTTE